MIDGEYIVRMVNLPGSINGAVRLSDDGFANIYINDQLSPMARRRAFDHERRHIENNDFYNDKSIMEVESCQESESKN
jgi:hypothetical protein